MIKGYTKGKRKRALLIMMALLVVLAMLMGCGPQGNGEVSPTASAPITDTKAEGTSSVPEPSEDDKVVFEGLVGQIWYALDIPLFERVGSVRDLAYGAGQLWAVGIQKGTVDEDYLTPPLLVSQDALHWEQVDLKALGLPENLSGEARLLGTEKEIIVIFENPGGMSTLGDTPQNNPWILRGDGINWQVIGDEAFGPWQVNKQGSNKYLNYWDLEAFALHKDDLILMPGIGWFEPYKTSNRGLGLGRVSSDGKAQLVADMAKLKSDYTSQTVYKMLDYQDELLVFASSYKPRQEKDGINFNLWRSKDGDNWTNETPDMEDRPDYIFVNDATEGPQGLLVVGWQAAEDEDTGMGDPLPIALFSADGKTWSYSTFGQEWEDKYRIAANHEAYFAYGAGDQVWTSLDGLSWENLSPLTYYKHKAGSEWTPSSSSYKLVKVIGFPQGLIAIGGRSIFNGTSLLFSGELPFDYLDQK